MTVKGTLIATLAAGYLATMAPIANAAEEPAPAPKSDKAGCKGKDGCKGHDGKKAKGDKAGCKAADGSKEKDKKEAPPAPPAPAK